MSSTYINLSGVAKWVRIATPDPLYDNYSVNLYLDEKSRKAFDESGLRLEPKTDEDGTFIKLRCPTSKLIKNELVAFEAPKAIDKNKNPIDPWIIGNGSRVRCNVIVFDTRKGKGHRLLEVMVTDLVEYKRDNEGPSDKPF